ncbi:hypothetical protein B0H14DRAFT_2367259, partial [Mycena olivaceomarginata]
PKTGVSINLLKVYCALFERSCDAINALSSALHTIYDQCGFQIMSILMLQPDLTLPAQKPGMLLKDPFRTGLQQAVQWYSNLRTALQTKMEDVLTAASPAPTLEAADTSAASADTSATIKHPAQVNTPIPTMAPLSPYLPVLWNNNGHQIH